MKAMVLAAGLGTRLRPLTYEITKPMVPVLDRPVMEHILDLIERHPFDGVIANLHYFPETIREHFGERISYRFEEELLGTAGGVRACAEFFGDEPFLVISGDALTDIDLTALRRPAPRGGRDRDARRQAGRRHARVRRRAARPRRAHHGLSGEAGARGGAVGPRQLRHLHVRPEHLRLLPRPPVRRLGQRRVPGAARRTTCRSTSTRSSEYWNDVGSLGELRQGTFDALRGELQLEMEGEEVRPGVTVVGPSPLREDTERRRRRVDRARRADRRRCAPDGPDRARRRREGRRRRAAAREHRLPGHRGRRRARS